MTQRQYEHLVVNELEKINLDIDLRILYGADYSDLARRHKMLLDVSRRLKKNKVVSGWGFVRAMKMLSFF
ncbi:MAG TPA: hypothetical protein PLF31_03640 [Candidatus Paceibacterota bacterium]|nr:hypothetical protein [Candidatus Paceibacterota bacterium]